MRHIHSTILPYLMYTEYLKQKSQIVNSSHVSDVSGMSGRAMEKFWAPETDFIFVSECSERNMTQEERYVIRECEGSLVGEVS